MDLFASAQQKSMEMARKECEDEKTIRKRKKVDRFASLPDDIVLEILKRVPDVFLRYKAKHVCRRWLDIITNRILLHHSSFIIQNMGNFTVRIVDIGEEEQGLQVKEQNLEIPCKGRIRSWCNEFLLISDNRRGSLLYVYNLITKEGSYLPKCNESCEHYMGDCLVALSFDGFKGIYKVVHLFIKGSAIQCEILILRKDVLSRVNSKWKKIQAPNLNESLYYRREPISVQGRYFHWEFCYPNRLVSLDMVKEEFFLKSPPGSDDRFFSYFFVMGDFLGLLDGVSRHETEIWVLKDFHGVKWEKLHSVSLNNHYFERYPGKVIEYRVFGMIRERYSILECRLLTRMFSYDLKNGVAKRLDIHIKYTDESCVLHSSAPSFI